MSNLTQTKDNDLLKSLEQQLSNISLEELEIAEWLLKHPEFEEKPVPIKEFIESSYYLNLLKPDGTCAVFPKIQSILEEVFSGEVESLYIKYPEVVFCAGIGSGKSFFSSIAISYMLYTVACIKDPAAYFNKAPGTHIYFMNMSVNERNATKVVFGEIKARIDNSPWFKERFPFDPRIASELKFPKNLSIIPGNSQETFFEGFNILGGIIDEADSHKKTEDKDFAEVGYDAIKGRVKSRFGAKGMVIIIGSPKTVDGFIMTKLREAEEINQKSGRRLVYGERVAIWDAHPAYEYSGKTFHFKKGLVEIDVPIEYEEDFRRNPEKALRDLAAIPSYACEPFFAFPEKVTEGFDPDSGIPYDEDTKKYAGWFRCFDKTPRVIHIDLGLNKNGGDACGFSMGHVHTIIEKDGEKLPVIKMDLIMKILAPPGGEIQISDIRQRIYDLKDNKKFNIWMVTMDGWNSADTLQQLKKKGIRTELLSIDRTTGPYESLKESIYDDRLKYYYHKPFIDECVRLELVNGNKVDHPTKGSKDVSDSVAGVVFTLLNNIRHVSGSTMWRAKLGGDRITKDVSKGEI